MRGSGKPKIESGERILEIDEVGPSRVFLLDHGRLGALFPDLYRIDPRSGTVDHSERNPGNITRWFADDSGVLRMAVKAPTEDTYETLCRNDDQSN